MIKLAPARRAKRILDGSQAVTTPIVLSKQSRVRRRRPPVVRVLRIKTRCVRTTLHAICVEIPEIGSPVSWVPRTAIHPNSQIQEIFDEGVLVVYEWFARRKGWFG